MLDFCQERKVCGACCLICSCLTADCLSSTERAVCSACLQAGCRCNTSSSSSCCDCSTARGGDLRGTEGQEDEDVAVAVDDWQVLNPGNSAPMSHLKELEDAEVSLLGILNCTLSHVVLAHEEHNCNMLQSMQHMCAGPYVD